MTEEPKERPVAESLILLEMIRRNPAWAEKQIQLGADLRIAAEAFIGDRSELSLKRLEAAVAAFYQEAQDD